MDVNGVVAAFGNTPGNAALFAVFDLALDGSLIGLIEQRVFVGRHDQQGHEVFEHRAAPGNEHRFAAGAGEQTAESEPAFLRKLSLRDRDEIAQAGFGSEQVVIAVVAARGFHLIADGQQAAGFVEQEIILGAGEAAALLGQVFECLDPLASLRAGALRGEFAERGNVVRAEAMNGVRSNALWHWRTSACDHRRDFAACGDSEAATRRRRRPREFLETLRRSEGGCERRSIAKVARGRRSLREAPACLRCHRRRGLSRSCRRAARAVRRAASAGGRPGFRCRLWRYKAA